MSKPPFTCERCKREVWIMMDGICENCRQELKRQNEGKAKVNMTEQQQKEAEQVLADFYHDACHIEATRDFKLLRDYSIIVGLHNAFWVLVNRPNRVNRVVIMLETEKGWHIGEIPSWINEEGGPFALDPKLIQEYTRG